MKRLIRIGAFAALFLLLALAGAVLWGRLQLERPGPLREDANLIVERGASLPAIARQLEEAEIIEDSLLFRIGARLVGASRDLKAGEYAFPAGVSIAGAIDILVAGKTVLRQITVPEGLTSAEIAALLESAEGLNGAVDAIPADGSLLPETYSYAWADGRGALVGRMQQAMTDVIAELWPERAEGLPFDSPRQAVILASIVEKETAVPEERPLVASVFVNRLKRGMRLQSDPTVVYAVTNGSGPLDRPLRLADLRLDNPYNTYRVAGLPPGPIANPGRASLEAVLNPAQSDYLYFVADGSGGHAFSRTLAEHNRNVAKWRRFQRNSRR